MVDSNSNTKIFIETTFSCLFFPSETFKHSLEQERDNKAHKISVIFMSYLSIIIAIVSLFLFLYPEPLYYGVSGTDFQQEMPTMLIPNIPLALLILLLISFSILFLFQYMFIGYIGYKLNSGINRRESAGNLHTFKNYLTFYAYTFTPYLFLVPIITLWTFFVEGLIITKPFFPFIDLTIPNIILLSIFGFIYFWKLYIEIQLNRQFFTNSKLRAAMPVFIQLAILVGIFLSLYIISLLLFNSLIGVVM